MNAQERAFVAAVWKFYREHGRHDLPWRRTIQPYKIVVSEVMLQQTQVSRVLPKYRTFVHQWPTTKALAEARLKEVLTAWQGLGYNSRAKRLWECAQVVTQDYHGRWPRSYEGLQSLPGIGPYTAGAVMAFAYNEAVPILETNIRTVYLHHFFPQQQAVSDQKIAELVKRTLDQTQPREWYWALMDYGSYLKQTHGNNIQQSKHYTKQSRFIGSNRQVRGAIMRTLTRHPMTRSQLRLELASFQSTNVEQQLKRLLAEGLVVKQGGKLDLP